ncbi:Maf family protein [Pseudalkalibacillus berkeleyi]|uniref:dTTP/UTP pyrophosphatase n=1 Tax=Pseudalkalibacillus berkeleyi TaxID=1069813 RepID=A0ABS9GZH9_9BACL|nr:Maf family protein [Pseudalkalibacillus berkeleyi]MCF6138099.1 Maf family protein [Pseudalkalibacillus berkeleyi]
MKRLILASGSPRRKELLETAHLPFIIQKSSVNENISDEYTPAEIVEQLSLRKAKDIAQYYPDDVVLGSDTVVVYDGQVLGKPKSDEDAYETLSKLSGKTHQVYTGVAIISEEREICFHEATEVTFWTLTSEEIKEYVSLGECKDKAGSYGIQGYGSTLVKQINGDYFNVVGLPISRTVRELKSFDITKRSVTE